MYKRGKLPKGASQAPGPAVTSFIDVRKKRGGFMMEDLTVPSAFLPPYLVGSAMSCGAMRKPENYPTGQQWYTLMKVRFSLFTSFEKPAKTQWAKSPINQSKGVRFC